MEPKALERMLGRTRALLEGAHILNLPIVYSEQYPKGLGRTVKELQNPLQGIAPIEKMRFSAALPALLEKLAGRTQILIAGMESHICVFQTARDLAEGGRTPILCADAILSRNEEDRRVGLAQGQSLGAMVTTVEGALFDILGEAGTPEFKAVSAVVR
jgi:hypothetical protein